MANSKKLSFSKPPILEKIFSKISWTLGPAVFKKNMHFSNENKSK
jgi:hypothetical protein